MSKLNFLQELLCLCLHVSLYGCIWGWWLSGPRVCPWFVVRVTGGSLVWVQRGSWPSRDLRLELVWSE